MIIRLTMKVVKCCLNIGVLINIKEIWEQVVGYEDLYEVSNLGNVRSLDRKVLRNDGVIRFVKGKQMNKALNTDGYRQVKLSKNGKSNYIAIHRLVAEAFIKKPYTKEKLEVNHKDCNRENNYVTNLEWVTHKENIQHSIKMGNHICCDIFGEKNPNYRNTTLKERYANGTYDPMSLARKGKQNGRCIKVSVKINGKKYDFNYLGECAEYLIDNGFTNANVNSVRYGISKSIKEHRKYLGLKFIKI